VTRIKICGICSPDHAIASVRAGADLIGLVFYPRSRRYVELRRAREIAGAVPRESARVVGLFVNQALDEITGTAWACGLDYVQLSGNEYPGVCRAVAEKTGLPIIKAIRARGPNGDQVECLAAQAALYPEHLAPLLLVDAPAQSEGDDAWGGVGQPWGYPSARGIAAARRLLLAGGLNAKNVADAIFRVRPWGVDVSSGVETGGVKDPAKIVEFIRAVRVQDTREQDAWKGD